MIPSTKHISLLNGIKKLNEWLKEIKSTKRKGKLPFKKIFALESLGVSWNKISDLEWEKNYALLKQFKRQYGHCMVPQKWTQNTSLALWVGNQRRSKKKKILKKEYINRLNNIGFAWDTHKFRWEKMYNGLINFKNRNGHCNVPTEYKKHPVLGRWVAAQGQLKKRNKLKKEYINRLNRIGFVWGRWDWSWNSYYKKLMLFKKNHGHCGVSRTYKDTFSLWTWVQTQRKNKIKGILTQDHIDKLNRVGFFWKSRIRNYQWIKKYKSLFAFKKRYGHCNVPSEYPKNPSLGGWVHSQRKKNKSNTLAKERVDQLNYVGFVWDARISTV
jgi:hypothetical protein